MEEADPISFHVLKRYQDVDAGPGARSAEDWQLSPELPVSQEIMAREPPPLPQVSWEDAPNKREYLETQYRLNRIEGTELLRRAVNQIRDTPQMTEDSDFYIYTQACSASLLNQVHSYLTLEGPCPRVHVREVWGSLSYLVLH
jgi:hypothetical protein